MKLSFFAYCHENVYLLCRGNNNGNHTSDNCSTSISWQIVSSSPSHRTYAVFNRLPHCNPNDDCVSLLFSKYCHQINVLHLSSKYLSLSNKIFLIFNIVTHYPPEHVGAILSFALFHDPNCLDMRSVIRPKALHTQTYYLINQI